MKIGVLTFSKSINYGATLQAVALQKVLQQQNADVCLMDHRCAPVDSASKVFDFSKALKPAYTLPHLVNMPCALKRQNAFRRFWHKHACFGSDNPHMYDAVVVGSDQVWNYKMTEDDWFYFLDFEKKNVRKYSYAASLGLSEIGEEYAADLATKLADFNGISVRETTAAKLIGEILGKEVPVVLDPTLLLDGSQWATMADNDFSKKDYIFVYTVFNSDSLWDFACRLSRRTGLPIYTISYSKFHRHKANYLFSAGPDEWLSYIQNASYVVTNSFHGMAFSLNFEKQFYYELPPKASGVGSRLQDMAEKYGLTEREISHNSCELIDYKEVSVSLLKDRKESLAFIKKITE